MRFRNVAIHVPLVVAVIAGPLALADVAALGVEGPAASQSEPDDRFAWQNDVALVATEFETAFPESYAGAEVVSTSPAVAVVRFKGEVPAGVADQFNDIVDVNVRLEGGQSLSQVEVNNLVYKAHSAASEVTSVRNLTSEYDNSARSVVVTAGVPAGLDDTRPQVSSDISNRLREVGVGSFIVRTAGLSQDESRYGGGRLEVTGSETLACTAGFNVVNSAGVTGISTAGHCSNLLTHENTSGSTEYATTYKSGHHGTYGDFQWSITGDTEPDDFYYSWSSTRDVAAVASPLVNQNLCRFGHITGAQCAEVETNSVCSTTSAGTACNLTRMKKDTAQPGDSGGPWYYGNTAYGIHKGDVAVIGGTRDVFSKATLIDEALGVVIRTTG